jgi:hypothetical protein
MKVRSSDSLKKTPLTQKEINEFRQNISGKIAEVKGLVLIGLFSVSAILALSIYLNMNMLVIAIVLASLITPFVWLFLMIKKEHECPELVYAGININNRKLFKDVSITRDDVAEEHTKLFLNIKKQNRSFVLFEKNILQNKIASSLD